jgi:hypothetical protein
MAEISKCFDLHTTSRMVTLGAGCIHLAGHNIANRRLLGIAGRCRFGNVPVGHHAGHFPLIVYKRQQVARFLDQTGDRLADSLAGGDGGHHSNGWLFDA